MSQEDLIYLFRYDFNSSIIGLYSLFSLLLLAYISFNYRVYVKNIVKANLSFRLLKNQLKDDSNVSIKASIWFNLFFLLVINLGVFFCVKFYLKSGLEYDINVLGISTLLTFGVFVIKYGFKIFLGKVFKTEVITNQYFTFTSIRDKGFSLIFFPIIILFAFNSYLQDFSLVVGKALLLIYLFFRWISGFLVGIKLGNIPYFYSILYICTLEILPIVIAMKAIGQNILA